MLIRHVVRSISTLNLSVLAVLTCVLAIDNPEKELRAAPQEDGRAVMSSELGEPLNTSVALHAGPGGACCTGATCIVATDFFDCFSQAGYYLGDGTTCSGQCALGSCCTGPAVCDDSGGSGSDEVTCSLFPGIYVGGTRCDSVQSPCPVCASYSWENCQIGDRTFIGTVAPSDLSGPSGATRRADDFKPFGTTLSQVCTWGAYLDPSASQNNPPYDCSGQVSDSFTVTVYNDAGNMPGTVFGSSIATATKDIEAGSMFELNYDIPLWAYQLTLDSPIVGLTSGGCYWLEVRNNTALPPGNTCGWYWARFGVNGVSNDFSFSGTESGYSIGGERASDIPFCVDTGLFLGVSCATVSGGCCSCPSEGAVCTDSVSLDTCNSTDDVWHKDEICGGITCPATPPSNDDCGAATVITDGTYYSNNACATTDGPNPIPTELSASESIVADQWYEFTAPSAGYLTVDVCVSGEDAGGRDTVLAVYHDEGNPIVCQTCPLNNAHLWPNSRASDEGCIGIPHGAGGIVAGAVSQGDCFVIRVGGYGGGGVETGLGYLTVSFVPDDPIVDCNGNGVPDADDISGPTSTDCNTNDIPDECESAADCQPNLVPDICDVAGGGSLDCNGNDVPDECETAVTDCNSNGAPDDCDIAACAGSSPECDDCNLNGIPDGCEVPASTGCPGGTCVSECLVDANEDCVPDECIEWTGAADSDFSNGTNWEGGTPPDSNDNVTIGDTGTARNSSLVPATVLLDINASVATVRIVDGATLNVTEPAVADLTIVEPDGLSIRGAGVLSPGQIRVAHDRLVDVSGGQVNIEAYGQYLKDPTALSVTASLVADSLTIDGDGGIRLDDSMSLNLTGDLVHTGLTGAAAISETRTCSLVGLSNAASLVGVTPPPDSAFCRSLGLAPRGVGTNTSVEGTGEPTVVVQGDIEFRNAVESINELTTLGVQLGGNFTNHATNPTMFNWESGRLRMDGSAAQIFEVAGLDLRAAFDGLTFEGFLTAQDTIYDTAPFDHTNFSLGALEVSSGRHVMFVNDFGNSVGVGSCTEALYVHDLVLGDGSTVTLDNSRVYFESLTAGQNVAVNKIGCGELVDLIAQRCTVASQPEIGKLFVSQSPDLKNRYLSVKGGDAGRSQSIRVTFQSLPSSYSSLNGNTYWAAEPVQICENSSEGTEVVPPACGPAPGQPQKWFWASKLVCDRFLAGVRDWTTLTDYCSGSGEPCTSDGDCAAGTCGVDGVVHLHHPAIVPSVIQPGGGDFRPRRSTW